MPEHDKMCVEHWTVQSLINYCIRCNIDPKELIITAKYNRYFEPRPWVVRIDRGDFALKRTVLLDQSCGAGELIPEGEL